MKVLTKVTKAFLKIIFGIALLFSIFFVYLEFDSRVPNNNKISKVDSSLLIGAFNIQIFGESKMSKSDVVASLIEILARYDIVLIEEIRDKKGEAIIKLLHRLNMATGNKYSLVISNRLGNSNSKEQYAFIYDKNKVKVIDSYNFSDIGNHFEREPFSVKFKYENNDFILVGVHIDPDLVFDELSELSIALKYISIYLADEDLVLMGDLNADCNYINDKELKSLVLFQNYNWLIDSLVDTTVSKTDCAYDRIITSESLLFKAKNPNVYHFDEEQNLNNKKAKRVSDHYPVEFLLDFN